MDYPSDWQHAIDDVLADPTASTWLKTTLRHAGARDPVDAVNDAEILATLLRARCDAILAAS